MLGTYNNNNNNLYYALGNVSYNLCIIPNIYEYYYFHKPFSFKINII